MNKTYHHRPATLHPRRPQPRGDDHREGHTLIEILLALGLSLVILVAVYAALDQHWRYAEAGQRQTERMQVTRALFERLSLDLRAVAFQPSDRRPPAVSRGAVRIGARPLAKMDAVSSLGIVGDAETIMMQIAAAEAGGLSGPPLVRWQLQLSDSEPGDRPSVTRRERAADRSTAAARGGLARLTGATQDGAERAAASTMRLAPNELLAPEVTSVRFRYFAEGTWFEAWNSVARQQLPRAVEVTIGFRRPDAANRETDVPESTGTYRLVVPIPAAEA